ncbi:MAG TPA: polyprenyl synthetase family protein [Opitutaceae bacterium]|nr:polyprenyl synthetase family protein [Opitutaceae bacterium]
MAASPDFSAVLQQLAPHLAALDAFLQEQVGRFEPEVRDMAAYCLESSGKRLRPALVFLSGWKDGQVSPHVVRAAAVVEMVHLATLVHDDIMDGAAIRRNRGTAARAFGPEAAVLLGDALFAQALHVASQFPTPAVCLAVSASTRQVCSGEIMQTLRRRDVNITVADYRRIIDLKTAELFRVSCQLGSSLAGFAPAIVAACETFGRRLGIAYQIYDDLVDFLGEEKRVGKTLGTDLASGKLTLPLMLLLERLPAEERGALLASVRQGGAALGASSQRMRELGIGAAVVAEISAELTQARTALEPHAGAPAERLVPLCDMLAHQVAALHKPAAA